MKKIDRIRFWFQLMFQVLLVIAGVVAIFTQNWIQVLIALVALFLTFLPSLIERRYQINIPNDFELLVLVFLYLSLYLGELQNFYNLFAWWDLFLHSFSGVILGAVGLALVHTLNEHQVSIKLSPGFVAMFAVTFAISLGVAWEIFEFSMDSFFGLNMQKSGVPDTMWDLIVDAIGAINVSLLGYWYLKSDPKFIEKLENRLLRSRRS
jgi:hypothetical protein